MMFLKQHFHALVLAFQFLTRIPVYRLFPIANLVPSKQVAGKALLYYPAVGLVIGLWLAALPWLLCYFAVDVGPGLQAGLVLVLWVWITGGLHLDGLADSADAWMGGFGDRQRTLDLMKDPTCGPSAVVVLVLVLLLKWLALTEVLAQFNSAGPLLWTGLIMVPILARYQAMLLVVHTPYVRDQGLGSELKGAAQLKWVWLQILAVAAGLGWATQAHAMDGMVMLFGVIFVVAIVGYWFMRRLMLQRINGWTGDTAGASIEVAEMLILLSLAMVL